MPEKQLESWQIPKKPLKPVPNRLSLFIFRIFRRVYVPIRNWYLRMDAEAQIRSLGSVGSRPLINGPIQIISPEKVSLGKDVSINPGLYAQGTGGLSIGSHVHFGQNVRILTQNHNFDEPDCLPYDKKRISKPVMIGDCVWVGDNVCIVPGVNIGEGAVIAMGAVVTKDVPALAVVGGAPAEVIRMRNAESYWKLKREGKYLDWPDLEQDLFQDGFVHQEDSI